MEAWDYIKKGKAYTWKEKFAILKSKKICPEAFANIKDKNEITVIINQSKIEDNKAIMGIEKDWKIITFDMKLPFGLVGFLARITKELAEENISIFVISAFSTDHLLVKEKDLDKTLSKLKHLGFQIK